MKQPKFLSRIELAAEDEPGFWQRRGWDRDAFVRTMSRIDLPRDGDSVPGGRPLDVYGIASGPSASVLGRLLGAELLGLNVASVVALRGDRRSLVPVVRGHLVNDAVAALVALTAVVGGGGRGSAPPVGPPLSTLKRGQVAQCSPTLTVPATAVASEP